MSLISLFFLTFFIYFVKTIVISKNYCAYISRLNPGARGEHLAIQLSWMAPWLLVKRVCPVHLVERWGCSTGLWWWQYIHYLFDFLIRAGSIVDISLSSHRWNPGSIPQRRQKIILTMRRDYVTRLLKMGAILC